MEFIPFALISNENLIGSPYNVAIIKLCGLKIEIFANDFAKWASPTANTNSPNFY